MTLPGVESGKFGSGRRGLEVEDGVIWGRRYANDRVDPVADAVANALHWDFALPRYRVVAHCDDGWVTLTGEVERALPAQCGRSRRAARRGVRGVTNAITVGAAAQNRAPTAGVEH